MSDEVTMDDVLNECQRIGFGMWELGGLAMAEGATLAGFRDFLRTIPDGAGYDEFLRRSRGSWTPTDSELLEAVGPGVPDRVHMLLRELEFTGLTWSERVRWLRLAADEMERRAPHTEVVDVTQRCSFCKRQKSDAGAFVVGATGAHICRQCAALAHTALSEEQAT